VVLSPAEWLLHVGVKHVQRRADGRGMPWWVWVLVGWTGLAVVVAIPLAGVIREADRRELGIGTAPVRVRRRRIPLPPVAVALIGIGVGLEAVGLVVRTAGHDRGTARLLDMDQPLSVPRMYITGLFAVAALVAFLGGARSSGRRGWWVAVGFVAAVVAEVKGGGTVHVGALAAFGLAEHPVRAALVSAALTGAVLGGLWWLSRDERRDRRRVLSAFALYALASVALSAVSSVAGRSFGGASTWAATATFAEESGEVVGAVAVLIAVLVGVAPRLVLPADWALRRTADADTVDAPGSLPGWSPAVNHLRG